MVRVRIVDREELQDVMRQVAAVSGSHRSAAELLGISQPTFTRLLNGTTNAMARVTYERVRAALRREHRYWIDVTMHPEQYPLGDLLETFLVCVMDPLAWTTYHTYDRWLVQEHRRLHEVAMPTFERLLDIPSARSVVHAFLEAVRNRPDLPAQNDRRLWLALLRAVEPLSAAATTLGVERSIDELARHGELVGFLRAALRREKVLLDRKGDLARSRDVARVAAAEWAREMEDGADHRIVGPHQNGEPGEESWEATADEPDEDLGVTPNWPLDV